MLKQRKSTDCMTLCNDVKIPCIGYGTWRIPDEFAAQCVCEATAKGYRHVDTAAIYQNEAGVGEGIRNCGVRREDLFITTKAWVSERGYERTIAACERSMTALRLDYLDLYLLHWPAVERVSPDWQEVNAESWRALERLYHDGKVRAIGVSNFEEKHLGALMESAEVLPMVNQIECHVGYLQSRLTSWCRARGMVVEGWRPLGRGEVLQNETVCEIARKYGKTPAQICLRFLLQCGVIPLPKSIEPHRIAENIDLYDFQLAPDDICTLSILPEIAFSGLSPEEAPSG